MKIPSSRNPFTAIAIAICALLLLSFLPWSSLTGNFFKDFNILEDICSVKTQTEGDGEIIDPELLALMDKHTAENEQSGQHSPALASEANDALDVDSADVIATDTTEVSTAIPEPMAPRVGDKVLIEDYSANGTALDRFRNAIGSVQNRPVRIAIIGDSYIEGDVFSQDIREKLQTLYGGRGAGYQMMHTDIPGFRQSVTQTDKGWTSHDIRKTSREDCKWLAGEYFTGNAGATSTYKGVKRLKNADAWNTSKFLFIAPAGGTISVTTDTGVTDYPVSASDSVQCITVEAETGRFSVKNNIPGLIALGVWLDDNAGISVDCMSLRGNSGITHRKLSKNLAAQMSRHIPYDLIIVEYGINALSSSQKDYSKYGKYMEEVVRMLKSSYPSADVLLMGIGDRGQKSGGQVHSIATAPNMVAAQRDVARRTGIAFWDIREAMGGEDAIVDWRERKLVNADYIHLNHKGGEALAQLFVDALNEYLSR